MKSECNKSITDVELSKIIGSSKIQIVSHNEQTSDFSENGKSQEDSADIIFERDPYSVDAEGCSNDKSYISLHEGFHSNYETLYLKRTLKTNLLCRLIFWADGLDLRVKDKGNCLGCRKTSISINYRDQYNRL
ncbi:hypothetical protein AYI68_g3539 [Smittium mucronatum]|uniref:Uncharacterized protein n=1 Tax=Smittium mucronatum TaxID=133383 RepID=A0A1R0GZN5_9FUNG|nr:hypothetical protein AYI68_g3539 [Smittium mucronatum]